MSITLQQIKQRAKDPKGKPLKVDQDGNIIIDDERSDPVGKSGTNVPRGEFHILLDDRWSALKSSW